MRIAIIGTGISGLSAAWFLNPLHKITVYEANNYIGGHSRTIKIPDTENDVYVDTGFIVFNHKNYPNLTSLFSELKVPTVKSDMSFGATIDNGWLEYSSKSIFSQKKNLLRPQFWSMLIDIIWFNKNVLKYLDNQPTVTLGELLDNMKLSSWFRRYYLQAMGAAIWSCSTEVILDFPARTFLNFFKNHGLLTINSHPQWHSIAGGSREYIHRLTKPFQEKILTNCSVVSVARNHTNIIVTDIKGNSTAFDHVIFACHANQSLALIIDPSVEEKSILGSFSYQKNRVVVHSDESFMPKQRCSWSSWVYHSQTPIDQEPAVSLSYWMNQLQNLNTEKQIFVTLNPGKAPSASMIYDEHVFEHPVFSQETLYAQRKIETIQGIGNIWHCGAYQHYGFHEDGLVSAMAVASRLGAKIPWI